MKDVHVAEFNSDGSRDGEEWKVCGSSEKLATVRLRVRSVQKPFLEKRQQYFLGNMKMRFGAILGCFVRSCSPDERSFETPKRAAFYEMKVQS